MKLGFHYHIPAMQKEDGSIWMPGYLGVFIDGLAQEVDEVILFMHKAKEDEVALMDYVLSSGNISLVQLPEKVHMLLRPLLSYRYLKPIKENMSSVDVMLIRAPSPLLPSISSLCQSSSIPLAYLLVGDYIKSLNDIKSMAFLKRSVLRIYYGINQYYQNKFAKNACLVTNNPLMKEEYLQKGYTISEIRTTTLSDKDFYFEKKEFGKSGKIRLAYAGRIEQSKGIDDILKSIKILNEYNIDAELHIAGWDPSSDDRYLKMLGKLAGDLGLKEKFHYHGKKRVGEELLAFYRGCDIFVMASKANEGFPRTIWEAMSQGTVVIATKVGSIPSVLENEKNALLLSPHKPTEIATAIRKIAIDKSKRNLLITNAFSLAQKNTQEIQSKKLIKQIGGYLEK